MHHENNDLIYFTVPCILVESIVDKWEQFDSLH